MPDDRNKLYLFGCAMLMMWKNKKFGIVQKHRSFRFGEREGDWGFCKLVCPVDNCITMEVHRVGPEYLNWIEFQKRGLPLNDH